MGGHEHPTRSWRIQPHDEDRIKSLEQSAGVSPVVAQLLICRGILDPQSAKHFLGAKLSDLRDPEELPGISQAADRVFAAVKSDRQITIYGDYDADGMTGTAILYSCLKLLGADVRYYVPNRMSEGYGLNEQALRRLAERGASMVISVDCGIASLAEAEVARELGIELIVTDHHEMLDRLPEAAAIVHPRLPGSTYPFGGLCGAGVAFKLAWALCQRQSNQKRVTDRLRNFLVAAVGIAAIGTVADVVPLVDENRSIVRHGLRSLKGNVPPGLAELMKRIKLTQKRELSAEDIAFMIAPCLNAAGRLGQAQLGIELLVTDDLNRAEELASYIHSLNGDRVKLERSVYLKAIKQAKEQFEAGEPAFVLAGQGWHLGVIGIVAGRITEKYRRPTVVISFDELQTKPGTGSARSVRGLPLHEAFQVCSESLVGHGGHAAAAGLKIEESKLEDFREAFLQHVRDVLGDTGDTSELRIDAEAILPQLTLRTVEQLEQLAPFGQGNPRPLLCASGVTLAAEPKCMGNGEKHLRVDFKQHDIQFKALAFNRADWAEPLKEAEGPVDIAFRPVINEFRGRRSVELHLVDWRRESA